MKETIRTTTRQSKQIVQFPEHEQQRSEFKSHKTKTKEIKDNQNK